MLGEPLITRRTLIAVFAIAFVFRVMMLHVVHWPVVTDLYWSDQVALNLLQGHGFSASVTSPYVPGIFRSPGFPSFLAIVYGILGHSYTAALMMQAALDSGTAVLLALTASMLVPARTAMLAGVLYALYPYSAALCSMLHQDI